MAWFQQVVVTHRKTRFFIKADWDTWIHTTRLEVNLRMLSNRSEPVRRVTTRRQPPRPARPRA